VPRAMGRAFQITPEEAREDPKVVSGTFLVNSRPAHVLFDSGASDSFVSTRFTYHLQSPLQSIKKPFYVDTAGDVSILVDKIYRRCILEIDNHEFHVDLIPIGLSNFDIIVGMDWMSKYHADIMCYEKMIRIPIEGEEPVYVYGDRRIENKRVISFVKARKLLTQGCSSFLAYVVNTTKEVKKTVDDVPIVREFSDVFPDDLPGLPPDRQVEFRIDLVPGATPIAKTPYRLA
ncbi:hypothetical protein E9993_23220, partial [Labilibacter sediminis]